MEQVIENLYIGCHHDLANKLQLSELGIKGVLKLYTDRDDLTKAPDVSWLTIHDYPMPDGNGWEKKDFDYCNALIAGYINNNRKILVVCGAGKSRSATVVLSYLIKRGFSLSSALAYLKERRPAIDPSIRMLASLMEYHNLHPYLGTVDPKWL